MGVNGRRIPTDVHTVQGPPASGKVRISMANFTMDICESGEVLENRFFGNGGTSFLGYGESRNHVMLLACWLQFWERKVVVGEEQPQGLATTKVDLRYLRLAQALRLIVSIVFSVVVRFCGGLQV